MLLGYSILLLTTFDAAQNLNHVSMFVFCFFLNLNKNLHCVLQSHLTPSHSPSEQGSLLCNVVHVWEHKGIVYETWKTLPCVVDQVSSTVETSGET